MSTSTRTPSRTAVYIDGFNLYFGLVEEGWRRYLWLDLSAFSRSILRSDEQLAFCKYFTSRISGPPDKKARQDAYLNALATLPDLKIFFGTYQSNRATCNRCGHSWVVPNEKMTDVNIACEILSDAFQDQFDTAVVISADGDLEAPYRHLRALFPHKPLEAAFPPHRKSFRLERVASGKRFLQKKHFRDCQFPDPVPTASGFPIDKPASWI